MGLKSATIVSLPGAIMIRLFALLAVLVCAAPAVAQQPPRASAAQIPSGVDPKDVVMIETNYGVIVIKLRPDLAPKHAERIRQLARDKFYDNAPFHRVIAGFMAQTGDGQRGDGTGKSNYPDLAAEFSNTPFKRGIIGMARSASPNSANAQFFITFADAPHLNGQYTVAGEVVAGMDVVDKVKKGSPAQNGAVPDPDRMLHVVVGADVK
jgi:peptidylprolyl isomerase